jgi:hypothetical protein
MIKLLSRGCVYFCTLLIILGGVFFNNARASIYSLNEEIIHMRQNISIVGNTVSYEKKKDLDQHLRKAVDYLSEDGKPADVAYRTNALSLLKSKAIVSGNNKDNFIPFSWVNSKSSKSHIAALGFMEWIMHTCLRLCDIGHHHIDDDSIYNMLMFLKKNYGGDFSFIRDNDVRRIVCSYTLDSMKTIFPKESLILLRREGKGCVDRSDEYFLRSYYQDQNDSDDVFCNSYFETLKADSKPIIMLLCEHYMQGVVSKNWNAFFSKKSLSIIMMARMMSKYGNSSSNFDQILRDLLLGVVKIDPDDSLTSFLLNNLKKMSGDKLISHYHNQLERFFQSFVSSKVPVVKSSSSMTLTIFGEDSGRLLEDFDMEELIKDVLARILIQN